MEGDHLEFLLRKQWYGRCGYSSFQDFVREELQLAPRTAKRRVALSRLVHTSSELSAALDEGRLSPCQVMTLSRLREAPDLVSWIRIAEDCTVRELEDLVASYQSDLAGDPTAEVASELEAEEPGRRVTFAAPASAAVAWEYAMDMARRVLGWDAPPYRCIEAVLAETAVDLASADHEADASPVGLAPPGDELSQTAGDLPRTGDDLPPAAETRCYSPSEPPLLRVTREQLEALLFTMQDAEREVNAIDSMAVPSENDPDRSINALAELKRKNRSLRLILARLLRDMDAANVIAFFGHGSVTEFLTLRLKISARTAARFMSEAWTFEDNPELARAFASGRIGLGQAYLVNRVAVRSTQAAFIRRAEAVTHLQFEREVRFLERLAEYVPSVAREFHGPMPLSDLPHALVECLREVGWSEARVEECVGSFDGSGDPAVDSIHMARLEGLLELVAVAFEEHDRAVYATVPTLAPGHDDGQSAALPTLAPGFANERTTISFWAPESLITQWNAALERVRALNGPLPTWAAALFLIRRAVGEWERVDPSRRPDNWRILERDGWRCQAPGCTSRHHLEAHHIIFRSQNGSDDPENLVTLCHAHHRRGIHDGYVTVLGSARRFTMDPRRWNTQFQRRVPPRSFLSWLPPYRRPMMAGLEYIGVASRLEDLRVPPGNWLHELSGGDRILRFVTLQFLAAGPASERSR